MTLSLVKTDSQETLDFEALRDTFPDFARDIKINLGTVVTPEGAPDLTEIQILGVALASAYSSRNKSLIAALEKKAQPLVGEEVIKAAKASAALMAMNNVYYRFTHLVEDESIKSLPAKLRMTFMSNPGIPKIDFELMSLAISAINGCGMCMESHARELKKHGVSSLGVQSTVRIASVVNAAAQVLDLA